MDQLKQNTKKQPTKKPSKQLNNNKNNPKPNSSMFFYLHNHEQNTLLPILCKLFFEQNHVLVNTSSLTYQFVIIPYRFFCFFCNSLITVKIHLKSVVVHLSEESWSNGVWTDISSEVYKGFSEEKDGIRK